jgi:hypothetical protein
VIVVSVGEGVAKPGEQIIKLNWPNRDLWGQRNIKAPMHFFWGRLGGQSVRIRNRC